MRGAVQFDIFYQLPDAANQITTERVMPRFREG